MKLLLPASLALCFCTAQAATHAAKPPRSPKPAPAPTQQQAVDAALQKIDESTLLEHIKTLSSDEFEGRAPGTPGEALTIAYLQQQFKKLGLQPGNPDGTYLQAVPMAAISSHPALSYQARGGAEMPLAFGDEYVAWTARTEKKLDFPASELVFVGYGVQAPEFQWDDYKGLDLRGKTLLMLAGDPPVPDAKHPKQLDPAVFGGAATSYYGRWNYKFDMAAKMGAAAALIIHDTKSVGYPFDVVRNSWGRENYALRGKVQADAAGGDFPPLPGWLQQDSARSLFKAAGFDFDWVVKGAASRDFKPLPLGVKLHASAQNIWRDVASNNVVARIPGSDPVLKNQVVIYSAHWDHFGIDNTLPGQHTQQIFHGARDNASGVAALLAVARAYKALPASAAPKRTILFVLTTGQERGLLGAQYYARNPLYPLSKTLLDINLDGMHPWGRTRDVALAGMGKSSADEVVVKLAGKQGRTVRGDNGGESDGFYRGDQFAFARAGVPVVALRGGLDVIGKPARYGRDRQLDYMARVYHTVNDVIDAKWDLSGAVEDAELAFQVGYQVAQGQEQDQPQWKDKAEFKAARDKSLTDRKFYE